MRVLVIEDSVRKASEIGSLTLEVDPEAVFVVCQDIRRAWVELQRTAYDLIVLDLMMPLTKDGQPRDTGRELINIISESKLNRASRIVALTGYEELFEQQATQFAELGILLVYYDEFSGKWKKTIQSMIRRASILPRCDFVIICALEVERDAFEETDALVGPRILENGFDVRRIKIGESIGNVILTPRAGLVDASITTTSVLERYRPRLIAMSGICAGIRGQVMMGQVLVCETCWEYQLGKYTTDGFESETYQTSLREPVRQILLKLCNSDELLNSIYEGKLPSGVDECQPTMATMVSGSAVIASEEMREGIRLQHRKIDGIEMELAGVFRAGHLVDDSVVVVGAKAVVDFADNNKVDSLRVFSSRASARFVVVAIETIMAEYCNLDVDNSSG